MGILLFFAYAIRTIRNILYHLYWWDLKEWRLDRMKIHLRETYQGRRWMFGPLSLVKWLLIILYIFNIPYLGPLVFFLYLFEAGKILRSTRSQKRPVPFFRPKVVSIFVIALLFEWVFVTLVSFDFPLGLALLVGDKVLAFAIFFLVVLVNIPFKLHKKRLIKKATKQISSAKHLQVIGITGSYGKTTTKELVAQLISTKYRVFKTEKSQNSDIGIAEAILRADLSKYDIFVCELAAYTRGEIRDGAKILGSSIITGVVTGIDEQHQSLFKSIKNTKQAKFELIQAVKSGGTAIFNTDDSQILELVMWARKRNVSVVRTSGRDVKNYKGKLTGSHFRQDIAMSVAAAKSIGMKKDEIESGLSSLKLPKKTMNREKYGPIVLIDDTFNSNPTGVFAALEYLKKQQKKRVLVLQPIIELGGFAGKIHEEVGEKAAGVCDHIIVTNKNFIDSFTKGVMRVKGGDKKLIIGGPIPDIKRGVILFEGKETESYLNRLRETAVES